MTTLLKIGPKDHGKPITNEELAACELVSGYKYEVIDGKLYVTYEPDMPADRLGLWLFLKVTAYAGARPDVINYVSNKARVFIPAQPRETIPEPDLAAYQGI